VAPQIMQAAVTIGFDGHLHGHPGGMPEIPQKRQSIRPPVRLLLVGLAALLVLVVVWIAVSVALNRGSDDGCAPQTNKGAVSDRCT
jgi:hypothetical protein